MKKLIVITLIRSLLFALFLQPGIIQAQVEESHAAGQLLTLEAPAEDNRVVYLESFLRSYNSPLADDAAHFVSEADRLGLDWKLVAAIAGVESTFGKHTPTNSYNAWGWAVFTGRQSGAAFQDWQEGITIVSEGLKYKYIDRGAETIEQIGRIYAASPAWSWKVRFFLSKIENFSPDPIEELDITI